MCIPTHCFRFGAAQTLYRFNQPTIMSICTMKNENNRTVLLFRYVT